MEDKGLDFFGATIYYYRESPYQDYMTVMINMMSDMDRLPQASIGEYGPDDKVIIHVNTVFMDLPIEQQLAILFHELGHWKLGHLRVRRWDLTERQQLEKEMEADKYAADHGHGVELAEMLGTLNCPQARARADNLREYNARKELQNAG